MTEQANASARAVIDALLSSLVFALLCGAAALGYALYARLPTLHRTRETLDFTRLVTGLLVTFVALVLGLLIASVNAGFEKTSNDLQDFSADIIRLTSDLDELGPGTMPIRSNLRAYVASAIASTWANEPRPSGTYPVPSKTDYDFDSVKLGDLLHRSATLIAAIDDQTSVRQALRDASMRRIDDIESKRWTLIGEAHHTITPSFLDVTLLWLFVIFLSFGLNAPRNTLAKTSIALVALCVSGAFFVLLELDGPLDGVVKVPSEPMRHALRHIDRSLDPAREN